MTNALTFDRVSKHYRGSSAPTALRDDLAQGLRSLLARRDRPEPIRALDDVSFEIREGEPTAIIGVNGAGKTTALKLATRVAFPSSGRIRIRGRVAALIEVGTGLHPELTGRENIQLYGQILGLSRSDIRRRFDEIVEFAGVADALDRPLKQYSSGMQLRLGFSVAAHLEPDVLLVDEAIAVGDAGFQYRCVERMSELVRSGRTLVLVSHDMGAIETLCTRALVLNRGSLIADGAARAVVADYIEGFEAARREHASGSSGGPIRIVDVALQDDRGAVVDSVSAGDPLTVRITVAADECIVNPIVTVGINDGRAGAIAVASTSEAPVAPALLDGTRVIACRFEHLPLRPRTYEVWCSVRHASGHGDILDWQKVAHFHVRGERASGVGLPWTPRAPVVIPSRWTFDDGPIDLPRPRGVAV